MIRQSDSLDLVHDSVRIPVWGERAATKPPSPPLYGGMSTKFLECRVHVQIWILEKLASQPCRTQHSRQDRHSCLREFDFVVLTPIIRTLYPRKLREALVGGVDRGSSSKICKGVVKGRLWKDFR